MAKKDLKKYLWKLCSKYYRLKEPYCEICKTAAVIIPTSDVHHIIRRSQGLSLYFDERNWLSLCRICHSKIDPRNSLHNRFDICETNDFIKKIKGDDILEYLRERKYRIVKYTECDYRDMIADIQQKTKDLSSTHQVN